MRRSRSLACRVDRVSSVLFARNGNSFAQGLQCELPTLAPYETRSDALERGVDLP
jgi:hypothetical protein